MVSNVKLIYDFFLKHNGFNTASGQNYKIKDVVSILNEANLLLFENSVQRAEVDRRYEDFVRVYKVKHKSLTLEESGKYVIASYPTDLYKRLNQTATVSCEGCDCDKNIPIRIVQSDDLSEARRNPYRYSDFAWEQIIAEQGGNNLYVYHDNKLEIKTVEIDYYRNPTLIQNESLVNCGRPVNELDQVITHDVDPELLSPAYARKVVDVAVLIATAANKSAQDFQINLNKITSLDQIS